jgi:hypothetical protein
MSPLQAGREAWETQDASSARTRGLAPVRGWCEQAQGTGPRDGLGAPVRVELGVHAAHVGLDGVGRDVQFPGDLRGGQVGRQVAQYPGLAVGQRLQ